MDEELVYEIYEGISPNGHKKTYLLLGWKEGELI